MKAMPYGKAWEKRDKAIIAFAILTAARDDAIASLALKHVSVDQRKVFQDGREVRTKNRKTFTTVYYPVGADFETVISDWVHYLTIELGYGPNDPLFPKTEIGLDDNGQFEPVGLTREFWADAGHIRKVFKSAFAAADLPYFKPHTVRDTIERLADIYCAKPSHYKAWSMNMGHENAATTFTSYGKLQAHEQAQIMSDLAKPKETNSKMTPEAYAALQAILDANKPT